VTSGIGKRLAEARAGRGLELAEVEQRLKIRAHYLRAMEEERWDVLPGAAYARGFLRTYGDYVGLDGSALAEEYSERHGPRASEPGAEQVRQIPTGERPIRRPRLGAPARAGPRWRLIGAILVAAVLALLVVLGLTQRGHETSEPAAKTKTDGGAAATHNGPTTTEAPAQPPRHVTLRLAATGAVWVCLVDGDGRPVIEGATLAPGDKQGPFRARAFDVTFGNGQVTMDVNGDAVPVPSVADPLGYRVTPDKTTELAEAARPTCT
jgi:hypothetical protein